jgi:hypothetical protein
MPDDTSARVARAEQPNDVAGLVAKARMLQVELDNADLLADGSLEAVCDDAAVLLLFLASTVEAQAGEVARLRARVAEYEKLAERAADRVRLNVRTVELARIARDLAALSESKQ